MRYDDVLEHQVASANPNKSNRDSRLAAVRKDSAVAQVFALGGLANMTPDSKHIIMRFALRLAMFCAWFVFILFVSAHSFVALVHWVQKDDQARKWIAHSGIPRDAGVWSLSIIWTLLTGLLIWLPVKILNRKARVTQ